MLTTPSIHPAPRTTPVCSPGFTCTSSSTALYRPHRRPNPRRIPEPGQGRGRLPALLLRKDPPRHDQHGYGPSPGHSVRHQGSDGPSRGGQTLYTLPSGSFARIPHKNDFTRRSLCSAFTRTRRTPKQVIHAHSPMTVLTAGAEQPSLQNLPTLVLGHAPLEHHDPNRKDYQQNTDPTTKHQDTDVPCWSTTLSQVHKKPQLPTRLDGRERQNDRN